MTEDTWDTIYKIDAALRSEGVELNYTRDSLYRRRGRDMFPRPRNLFVNKAKKLGLKLSHYDFND